MKIVVDVEELKKLKEIFEHSRKLMEKWKKYEEGCKYKRKVISIPASPPECTKTNLSCIYYFCPLIPERVKREMEKWELKISKQDIGLVKR